MSILLEVPRFIVHDNGNNLMQNCLSRVNASKRTPILATKTYVVDRLNIKNHTDAWCQELCHTDKIPDLAGINSMVCEQTNYDTGKWRAGTKHMNAARYNFFFFIV